MFYVNYNDIDLTGIVDVKDVITTALPPRSNKSIDIWERQGSIYNGYKYKDREIKVTFIIQPSREEVLENEDILNNHIEEVKRAFDADSPKALFLGDYSKFIFAVPEGDVEINQIGTNTYEGEVNFICYDPMYYSEEAKQYDGSNIVVCENEGSVETFSIIDVGVSKDTHFVQIENLNNKKKILIGSYPELDKEVVKDKTSVLEDVCETTTGWTSGTISVDTGRSTNGTLSVTDGGTGIMAGDYGSKSTGATWYGTSARKNLGAQIEDFYIEVDMSHTSSGVNGDPTKIPTDSETSTSGSKTTYYKVTASSLNVRSGAGTKYKRIGSLKKGTNVYPSDISNGWAKITYSGKTGYVYTKYLKKYISDTTTTVTKKNFVTKQKVSLRASASKTSSLLMTIQAGEIVRCIIDKTNGYYKLAEKYNDKMGYVYADYLIEAGNASFEYAEELDTADDKTGLVELYGYTANNEKLFRIGLYDDNEWYEFTYPLIQVGSQDFSKDKTIAPAPKTKTTVEGEDDKLTVTKDTLLSGQYADWNDFYGKLGIQRKNGKWQSWIYKIQDGKTVKSLVRNETQVSGSPTGKLSYIVAYFGTSADSVDKASDVSISHIRVENLNPESSVAQNVILFKEGDVIKVNCLSNRVYVNDKPYANIDIGSQFFGLEVGENTIKISSDDNNLSSSVIYNERWL